MQKNLLITILLALCLSHNASHALTPAQAAATGHARAAYDKHADIDPAIVAMIHDVIEQITVHKSIADYAAEENWEKVIELATQPGIDLNSLSSKRGGWTALMLATFYRRLDVVTCLTQQPKIDLNIKKSDGDTALIFAAYYGCLDIVTHLTSLKDAMGNLRADLNAADNGGCTVLMWATHCHYGRLDIVKHLMQIKDASGKRIIDLNAKNINGETVFEYAQRNSTSEIVAYLKSLDRA